MRAKIVNLMMEMELEFVTEVTLGRNPGNQVVIPKAEVSDRHARIYWDEAKAAYVLEDLKSANGTRVDNVRVRRPETLGRMNVITIAEQWRFMFKDLTGAAPEPLPPPPPVNGTDREVVIPVLPPILNGPPAVNPATKPATGTVPDVEVVPLPAVLKAPEPASGPRDGTDLEVEVAPLPATLQTTMAASKPKIGTAAEVEVAGLPPGLEDPDATRERPALSSLFLEILSTPPVRAPLLPGENVVGRGAEATIRIGGVDVSRSHAVLLVEPTRVIVRDLKSRFGTFVDGRRIKEDTEVQPGQTLAFGGVMARIVG